MMMGIVSILGAAGMTYVDRMSRDLRRFKAYAAKQDLVSLIRQAANSSHVILESALTAGNGALRACVDPLKDAGALYTDLSAETAPCALGSAAPFVLQAQRASGKPITGAYDLTGRRCGDTANADCPILVSATFTPTCGPATCPRAELLRVDWKLTLGVPDTSLGLRPEEGTFIHNVLELDRAGAAGTVKDLTKNCPPGQAVTKVAADGTPTCGDITLRHNDGSDVPLQQALCNTGVPALDQYCPFKKLVGGKKTDVDCTSQGGAVVDVAEGPICRFNAANCDSAKGWTQYRNWSTTVSSPQPQCSGGYPVDSKCVGGLKKPIKKWNGHAWADLATEANGTVPEKQEYNEQEFTTGPNDKPMKIPAFCYDSGSTTCVISRTQVGCN
jgi:hypothetical protein